MSIMVDATWLSAVLCQSSFYPWSGRLVCSLQSTVFFLHLPIFKLATHTIASLRGHYVSTMDWASTFVSNINSSWQLILCGNMAADYFDSSLCYSIESRHETAPKQRRNKSHTEAVEVSRFHSVSFSISRTENSNNNNLLVFPYIDGII